MNYRRFFTFLLLLTPIFAYASGNTGGGGGKSAGQVQNSGGSFDGELDKSRQEALNERKGQSSNFDHTHFSFSYILKKNVIKLKDSRGSQINYKNVNKEKLNSYIQSALEQKKEVVDAWSREKQLSYYFNLRYLISVVLFLFK